MSDPQDVRVDAGVVWAVACGPLDEQQTHELALRAIALAEQGAERCILFDFRRAALTQDVLALHRQAENLGSLGVPAHLRMAMLCRQRTTDLEFWKSVLRMRGLTVEVFTDGEVALQWLHRADTV